MGADAQMIHRCAIERDATAGTGEAGTNDWQPYLSDIPCRLWSVAGGETLNQTHTVLREDLRMLIPRDIVVGELDQVHGVTDRMGAVIDARPLGILSVLARRDHQELLLESRSY